MYAHASSWTVRREIDKQKSVHSKSNTASHLRGWRASEKKEMGLAALLVSLIDIYSTFIFNSSLRLFW